jgi:hypothetical protein
MMNTIVRGGVVAFLVVSVGCGGSGPTSPSAVGQAPPAPSPTPTPAPTPGTVSFPPLDGPSRTFTFSGALGHPVSDFTKQSRFVLYDNGAFVLQYPPSMFGDGRFHGAYRDATGVSMFLFNSSSGRSVDETWTDATGTLEGDSLTIYYRESMHHADFEDAVYVLVR